MTEQPTTVEKAKKLLKAASEKIDDAEHDQNGLLPVRVVEEANMLVHMSYVQAQIATAEQLEKIAGVLDARMPGRWMGGPK